MQTHHTPSACPARWSPCTLGSSTGCTNLGFLYENGRGVKPDKLRAVALYQRGCDGTSCQPANLGGCVNVGRAYRDGIGVAKDEARAAEIFQEACDRKPKVRRRSPVAGELPLEPLLRATLTMKVRDPSLRSG
jgi:TPR repeat protein